MSSCEKEPELHPDAPVEISDDNFLKALIERGVDKNGDTIISCAEAEAITQLELNHSDISDMAGIEAFVNLETLYCFSNHLTALDLSENKALEFLECGLNQLTSLDISECSALESLYCYDNQLTTLDISKNVALEILLCDNNQLTALDLTQNIYLEEIHLSGNQLTSLDVSSNTALYILDCSANPLTRLDVSYNTSLYDLYLKKMPSLYEVCVWVIPYPFYAYTFGSPNLYFTTECSQ